MGGVNEQLRQRVQMLRPYEPVRRALLEFALSAGAERFVAEELPALERAVRERRDAERDRLLAEFRSGAA